MNISPNTVANLFACVFKRLELNLTNLLVYRELVEHHGAGNIKVNSEISSI